MQIYQESQYQLTFNNFLWLRPDQIDRRLSQPNSFSKRINKNVMLRHL